MMEISHPGNGDATAVDFHDENLDTSIVGLAVDYLTRLECGASPRDAFKASLLGAASIGPDELDKASADVDSLTPGQVDTQAIITACRLVRYDAGFRSGYNLDDSSPTEPDATTIEHIQIMLDRSRAFFLEYGSAILEGFTFKNGYTKLVDSGDGDFLTKDTLWEFKVISKAPTSAHTLQLLMYYLMGVHSGQPEFDSITHVGVFNPRLNTVYRVALKTISAETMEKVSHDVIGYGLSDEEQTAARKVQAAAQHDKFAETLFNRYGLSQSKTARKPTSTSIIRTVQRWCSLCLRRGLLVKGKPDAAERMSQLETIYHLVIAWICAKYGHVFAEHVDQQHFGSPDAAVFRDEELLHSWARYDGSPLVDWDGLCGQCQRILDAGTEEGEPCAQCRQNIDLADRAEIEELLRECVLQEYSLQGPIRDQVV